MDQRFSIGLTSGDGGSHTISFASLNPVEAKKSRVYMEACDGALSCIYIHFLLKEGVESCTS